MTDVERELFEKYKAEIRKKIIDSASCPVSELGFLMFRGIEDLDDPSLFFCDTPYEKNIRNLPLKGSSDKIPWSGWYWPIKVGALSFRWGAFKSFANTYNESVNMYHQPEEHFKHCCDNMTEFEDYVNTHYSPAEKYDLLVHDLNYTLTNEMKGEGKYLRMGADHDVPGWMGKCHGWAPAAFMEDRPVNPVYVSNGEVNITFYQEDIRALATNYWAAAKFDTHFIGARSDMYPPAVRDNETGLYEDYPNFSLNPASFVLVFANQIGINKKAFVYDPDSNGEIWNQPVYAYKMRYFHPLTGEDLYLNDTTVSLPTVEEMKNSRNETANLNYFAKKYTPQTKYVVGVVMRTEFVFENQPGFRNQRDNLDSRNYPFLLELDEDENVIGGEWLKRDHPIFIWSPTIGKRPKVIGDEYFPEFTGNPVELNGVTQIAQEASRQGAVLGAIVRYLIEQAK